MLTYHLLCLKLENLNILYYMFPTKWKIIVTYTPDETRTLFRYPGEQFNSINF